jgi:hypothetical protein
MDAFLALEITVIKCGYKWSVKSVLVFTLMDAGQSSSIITSDGLDEERTTTCLRSRETNRRSQRVQKFEKCKKTAKRLKEMTTKDDKTTAPPRTQKQKPDPDTL